MTAFSRANNLLSLTGTTWLWTCPARWVGCLFLVVLAVSSGCSGPDGPQRVPVRGRAMRNGTPLAAGSISFLPAQGHNGPAATAVITEGRYRLGESDGPVAGPHKVVVLSDMDPKAAFFAAGANRSSGSPDSPKRRWEFEVVVPADGPFEYDAPLD